MLGERAGEPQWFAMSQRIEALMDGVPSRIPG